MNELDFMIRQLWSLMVEIEEFDIEFTIKRKRPNMKAITMQWLSVKLLRDLVRKKEDLLKKIIEYKQEKNKEQMKSNTFLDINRRKWNNVKSVE